MPNGSFTSKRGKNSYLCVRRWEEKEKEERTLVLARRSRSEKKPYSDLREGGEGEARDLLSEIGSPSQKGGEGEERRLFFWKAHMQERRSTR